MQPVNAVFPCAGSMSLVASGCLLALFLLQGVSIIRYQAPTYDEARNLTAGYSHLATHDFRLYSASPPLVKILLAAPLFFNHRLPFEPSPDQWQAADEYQIGQAFLYASPLSADHMLTSGRLSNLLLGVLLVLLIGWWAYRLWGAQAAVVAIALAALEPNLVAHASLVTTDVGSCLFFVLTLYLLWEYAGSSSSWLGIATGVAAGLALVSKYSAISLIPIVGVILTAHALFESVRRTQRAPLLSRSTDRRSRLLQLTTTLLLVWLPLAIIIPAAYFFQGYSPWWSGLRHFLVLAAAGQPAFFLGHYSSQGWWSYFPMAFLIKTPTGTLALIAGSLLLCRAGAPLRRRESLVLLTPVVFVLALAVPARVNIGLRHILPVYPFLFVLASRLVTVRLHRPWLMPALVAAALTVTAASVPRVAPHQLAYFNELVGGSEEGHRYLSDSNLDWGQDLKGLKAFMAHEGLPIIYLAYFGSAPPAYYGIRYQYVPGSWPLAWPPPPDLVPADLERKVLAISVFNLQEVLTHHAQLFAWLRARRPVARVGYSIQIYDLTGDVQSLLSLSEVYRKMGLTEMATVEMRKLPN
jgi:4-amino-4-deoxy-L-arabinose transferase-like glycosyltransferase